MEEKNFQKYLIIIGTVVVAGGFLWVLYNFLSAGAGKAIPYEPETVVIQWEALELPSLSQLSQFSGISFPSLTLGRDDPLSAAKEVEAEEITE
jgi:hypothetical protein